MIDFKQLQTVLSHLAFQTLDAFVVTGILDRRSNDTLLLSLTAACSLYSYMLFHLSRHATVEKTLL